MITISSEYGFGSSDVSKSKATVPANSVGKSQLTTPLKKILSYKTIFLAIIFRLR